MEKCCSLACSSWLFQLAPLPRTTNPGWYHPQWTGLSHTNHNKENAPSLPTGHCGRGFFVFCFVFLNWNFHFSKCPTLIGSSWQKSGQHSPSLWEHKGLATWSKSNFVQLRVCEHSQCPNNVTHGYLSNRTKARSKRVCKWDQSQSC